MAIPPPCRRPVAPVPGIPSSRRTRRGGHSRQGPRYHPSRAASITPYLFRSNLNSALTAFYLVGSLTPSPAGQQAPEPGPGRGQHGLIQPTQDLAERPERRAALLVGSPPPATRHRPRHGRPGDLLGQARFADARLTRHQHHLTLAAKRGADARGQQPPLPLPPNEPRLTLPRRGPSPRSQCEPTAERQVCQTHPSPTWPTVLTRVRSPCAPAPAASRPKTRHAGAEDRRRHRRHRLRLGRLDHRPSNEHPRHPPDQGVAEW